MAILGIDEVGRGPLAGPLVVGAVILPEAEWTSSLKDSKKLTDRKRREIETTILEYAPAVGLGFVSAGEIDRMGMTGALKLATRRAVGKIIREGGKFSQVIIDGNINFLEGTRLESCTSTLIKGDDLIKEISAASIVAKVARDDYMCKVALEYPDYGFEKHVGYGTELHRKMMEINGLCPEHRRLVKLVQEIARKNGENLDNVWSNNEDKKNTTRLGNLGEDAVCRHLIQMGHEIMERNFRTKYYEIDIISTYENKIYFTEVKYRKNDSYGGGLMAIDAKKQKQMEFAAQCFMRFREDLASKYEPMLAVADVTGGDFRVKEWFELV